MRRQLQLRSAFLGERCQNSHVIGLLEELRAWKPRLTLAYPNLRDATATHVDHLKVWAVASQRNERLVAHTGAPVGLEVAKMDATFGQYRYGVVGDTRARVNVQLL